MARANSIELPAQSSPNPGRFPALSPREPPRATLGEVSSAADPLAASGPLSRPLDPADAIERWPADLPLAAFGVGAASAWSRWAILGVPTGETLRADADDPLAIDHAINAVFGPSRLAADRAAPRHPDAPPMRSGWIGALSYHLGRALEPRAGGDVDRRSRWPAILLHRCERVWCFDKLTRRWFSSTGEPLPQGPPTEASTHTVSPSITPAPGARDRYMNAVSRALGYIRSGDIYQVNLAHRLAGAFSGRTLPLFARLARASQPWYGSVVQDDHGGVRGALLSVSPELFFAYSAADRALITRPMKGTRPEGSHAELERSEKDRAELAMIVDLMRNDLGRVCAFGSVRVDDARTIERHGAVLQAVSSVSGRLRAGATLADAVRALFPGGSITGAPKIRAMQIIDELEDGARGPYCGALGYVSDGGDACFSMAIRTLAIAGEPGPERDRVERAEAEYWVGAGIVADSVPAAEWDETLVKATPVVRAFGLPPGAIQS